MPIKSQNYAHKTNQRLESPKDKNNYVIQKAVNSVSIKRNDRLNRKANPSLYHL